MQQTLRSENISPEKVSFCLWFLTQREVSNLFQFLYISLAISKMQSERCLMVLSLFKGEKRQLGSVKVCLLLLLLRIYEGFFRNVQRFKNSFFIHPPVEKFNFQINFTFIFHNKLCGYFEWLNCVSKIFLHSYMHHESIKAVMNIRKSEHSSLESLK